MIKMGLSTFMNTVKLIPHRHIQRPIFQVAPDSIKLTINTNDHRDKDENDVKQP